MQWHHGVSRHHAFTFSEEAIDSPDGGARVTRGLFFQRMPTEHRPSTGHTSLASDTYCRQYIIETGINLYNLHRPTLASLKKSDRSTLFPAEDPIGCHPPVERLSLLLA